MGAAWERHAMCEWALKCVQPACGAVWMFGGDRCSFCTDPQTENDSLDSAWVPVCADIHIARNTGRIASASGL